MKKILFALLLLGGFAHSQVGIGIDNPHKSSILHIGSLNKGVIFPKYTSEQRDLIASPATGLAIYNTTTESLEFYNGSNWMKISFSVSPSSTEIIFPGQTGSTLYEAVSAAYQPTNLKGYDEARSYMYSQIDIENGNEVTCVYTDFTVTLPTLTSTGAFNEGINTEHVFPQSKGAFSVPGDLHNLRPTLINVNSDRSSCPFNDIPDNVTSKWYYQKTISSSIPATAIENWSESDGSSGNCHFEPRESYKGNIARAVFYFFTIQKNYADVSFFNSMKTTLLQWHQQDPIDQDEIDRNAKVKAVQGNDNPFVLDATLPQRMFN